jgi:hypothetical protein
MCHLKIPFTTAAIAEHGAASLDDTADVSRSQRKDIARDQARVTVTDTEHFPLFGSSHPHN